jgi:hypothetical protein
MQAALRIALVVLGGAIVLIALLHIAIGPAAMLGGAPANATTDSEDRFYATFFLAYGAALIWCALNVPQRTRQIQLLMGLFLLGGMTRLISMAAAGLPHPFFIAMTAIELVLPAISVWVAARVAADARVG